MRADLNEGSSLSSRFVLLRHLGQGRLGEVWLAQDKELHESVALKILAAQLVSSQKMIERLRQEYRNTCRLTHPNIVSVFDFHNVEDKYFISMEYVDGENFQGFVGGDYKEFLPRILEITNALQHAHLKGVVHREIKPSNILCDAEGKARITDFGIASAVHQYGASPASSFTMSLYYMCPQQLTHQPPQPSDDIYSLGILLYELVTGHPPFYPDINERQIMSEMPSRMSAETIIPETLDNLIHSMLAKHPNERPGSMIEVKQRLEHAIDARSEDIKLSPAQRQPQIRNSNEIKPIKLDIGTVAQAQRRKKSRHTVPAGTALTALFVLVCAAALAFYLLPEFISPPDPNSARLQQNVMQRQEPQLLGGQEPWKQAQLMRDKQQADNVLKDLLDKQSILESKSVSLWANKEFQTATEKALEGDKYYKHNEFADATTAYEESLRIMDKLIEDIEPVSTQALQRGWDAFDAGDIQTATEEFNFVLAINPENEQAKKGLTRSGTFDDVIALMKTGRMHEENNNLPAALSDFQQANNLDPEDKQASDAIQRIDQKLIHAHFNQSMSIGLNALQKKDFKTAHEAFTTAQRIKPGATEPRDGLAQLELQQRLELITRHKKLAVKFEQQEAWELAAQHYAKALELDSTLVFAREGKQRSLQQAHLLQKINNFIAQPERLSSDQLLQDAINLEKQLLSIKSKSPHLKSQAKKLSKLIAMASTPIRVLLQSDNLTQVTIYKVRDLGKFKSLELELRPGTYIAVGIRAGFRDVRREFTVVAGEVPEAVILRCEERI